MTALDSEWSRPRRAVVVQPPVPAGDARRPSRRDHDHLPRSGVPRAARRRVRQPLFRRGRGRSDRRVRGALGVAPAVRMPQRQRGILPIQFALAGMNAHINRDLPAGHRRGVPGDRRRAVGERHARYDDFCARERPARGGRGADQARVRHRRRGRSSTPPAARQTTRSRCGTCGPRARRPGRTPRCCGRSATAPALHDAFFSRLDSFTGFAGRGLLVPVRLRLA